MHKVMLSVVVPQCQALGLVLHTAFACVYIVFLRPDRKVLGSLFVVQCIAWS